jgi:hypothetical protein
MRAVLKDLSRSLRASQFFFFSGSEPKNRVAEERLNFTLFFLLGCLRA